MSSTSSGSISGVLGRWSGFALWTIALAVTVGMFFARDIVPWAVDYPTEWVIPLKFYVSDFMKWLIHEANFYFFTFKQFTRGIASVFNFFLDVSFGVLSEGVEIPLNGETFFQIPPLSWTALVAALVIVAYSVRDWTLALLVGSAFIYLVV
ncbi:hypothetical protein LCGC14_2297800, partial [marine sediment metagenome]